MRRNKSCPLYPQKRTFSGLIKMSAKGHERTFGLAYLFGLFDHFVGALLHLQRYI
jgi:hypothetical protein